MKMAFPVTCGTMTVGQLLGLLHQFEDSAEVYFSADRLPTGVGRLCVQEADHVGANAATSATIVGYCRQADAVSHPEPVLTTRIPEPAPRPAETLRYHRPLEVAATRVA